MGEISVHLALEACEISAARIFMAVWIDQPSCHGQGPHISAPPMKMVVCTHFGLPDETLCNRTMRITAIMGSGFARDDHTESRFLSIMGIPADRYQQKAKECWSGRRATARSSPLPGLPTKQDLRAGRAVSSSQKAGRKTLSFKWNKLKHQNAWLNCYCSRYFYSWRNFTVSKASEESSSSAIFLTLCAETAKMFTQILQKKSLLGPSLELSLHYSLIFSERFIGLDGI